MPHHFVNALFAVSSFTMALLAAVLLHKISYKSLALPGEWDGWSFDMSWVLVSLWEQLTMLVLLGKLWPLLIPTEGVGREGWDVSEGLVTGPCTNLWFVWDTHSLLQHNVFLFYFGSGREVSTVVGGNLSLQSPWGKMANRT